jgi:23S rRNA (pseudouridine1915-N3)-methyltransferase
MLEITLIAMGNKMPAWVTEASNEFTKRLREAFKLHLIEIPLLKRGHTHELARILDKEAARLHAAIPPHAYLISLDLGGTMFSSETLAQHLSHVQHITSHLCFVIGGPEGLPQSCLRESRERWSLSSLTLPHPLARVVLLEALYRAWSIMNNHPYHK